MSVDSPETISGAFIVIADQIRSLPPAFVALLTRFRNCCQREKTFGYWMKYI